MAEEFFPNYQLVDGSNSEDKTVTKILGRQSGGGFNWDQPLFPDKNTLVHVRIEGPNFNYAGAAKCIHISADFENPMVVSFFAGIDGQEGELIVPLSWIQNVEPLPAKK